MGPWIVTADAIDHANLAVACRVNGVTKQESNTRHMYFKVPRLIADLSAGTTLEAGDIISTGTPEGVGFARTPAGVHEARRPAGDRDRGNRHDAQPHRLESGQRIPGNCQTW